jgi:hypothetical protein
VTIVWEPSPVPPARVATRPARSPCWRPRRKAISSTADARVCRNAGRGLGRHRAAAAGRRRGAQRLTFEAPPGKLDLRLTIEGTNGAGTLDREDRNIEVPDLTAPQVAISTPRVFRARTARDVQALYGRRQRHAGDQSRVLAHRAPV